MSLAKSQDQYKIKTFAIPDEKYLKLKMIIDDSDSILIEKIDNNNVMKINDFYSIVNDFLNKYSENKDNKIEFVKKFLVDNNCLAPYNLESFYAIAGLLNFKEIDKLQLAFSINQYEFFEP
jgi:hypothetical protein